MATIYRAPKHLIAPNISELDYLEYEEKANIYEQNIIRYCEMHGSGDLKGKVVEFPVADNAARYVVYSSRELIHIDTYDSYQIPAAHERGLSKEDIECRIRTGS